MPAGHQAQEAHQEAEHLGLHRQVIGGMQSVHSFIVLLRSGQHQACIALCHVSMYM